MSFDLPIRILIAFVLAVVIGDLGIRPIRNRMYEGFQDFAEQDTLHRWRPQVVGYIERFLYAASIALGFAEFVAIWLALKVAGQWDRWKLDMGEDATRDTNRARATYTVYLVGNGLSIIYGAAGAIIVTELSLKQWPILLGFIVCLVFLNLVLYLFILCKVKEAAATRKRAEDKGTHEML